METAAITWDIELILLSELGTTDERIVKFIDGYAALSDHISVTTIDPVLYPSVLEEYSAGLNTLVVKNSETGKFRTIAFTGTEDSLIQYSIDFSTYEYYETGFDAEGQITSAISYVSSDSSGTVYSLTGHGEMELGDTQLQLIDKSNLTVGGTLDILLSGGIPADCGLLVIYNPTSDISADEKTILLDYLAAGGDIFAIIDRSDLTTFNSLLKEYGLEMQSGYVGDTGRYYQQFASFYGYYCIAPVMSTAHDITSGLDTNVFTIYPRGMFITDPARDTITTTSFLSTSDTGIEYVDENTTKDGTYVIGATAVEDVGGDEAILTVISSAQMFDEEIVASFPSMANTAIFTNVVTSGFDGVSNIVIPAKSLEFELNTINSYQWWSLLYMGVIPICVFVGGLIFWLRRRKR